MKSIAVILAGGVGEKFWPRSVSKHPKQFNHMVGESSMLFNTYARLKAFYDENDIYVVTNNSFFSLVSQHLPNLPKANIILEPYGRNTAPALMLTQILLEKKYGSDCVMCAFPSDHIISNEREFQDSVNLACNTAYEKERIVILGIKPVRPETQYGYIQIDSSRDILGDSAPENIAQSKTFAEKPDISTARLFLEAGDFLWNSGIFCSRFDVFANKCKHFLPFHYQKFSELKSYNGSGEFIEELSVVYQQISSISLDYGILEKETSVIVVKAHFAWSDLVTWDEYYRLSMKDGSGNVALGEVITHDSENCLILAKDRVIGVAGVDDLIIIDSDDALFICRRGESGEVQKIVDQLKKKQLNKFL